MNGKRKCGFTTIWSLKKEENLIICSTTHGIGDYVKWNKPGTER
jgi:hypothetical protein